MNARWRLHLAAPVALGFALGCGGAASGGTGGPEGATGDRLEAIRVVRGDPRTKVFWDLTIRGVALEEYEGKVVTVRLGKPDRAPERLGSGQARIEGGAFALFFPEVWEASVYKQKLVYIDVDEDGSCDLVSDMLFADNRAQASAELVMRGSGEHQRDGFPASDSASDCALFNSSWPRQ